MLINNTPTKNAFSNLLIKIDELKASPPKSTLEELKNFTDWSFILDDYSTNYIEDWVILHISMPSKESFGVGSLDLDQLNNLSQNHKIANKNIKTLGLIKEIIKIVYPNDKDKLANVHGTLNKLYNCRSKGKTHGEHNLKRGSLIKSSKEIFDDVIIALEKLNDIFVQIHNKFTQEC